MENGRISKEFTGEQFFSLSTKALNDMGLRALHTDTNYLETAAGCSAIKPFDNKEVITLEDFCFSYGRQAALNIDRLELPSGGVIAVVGHNGAGKSTFTRCLCGLQKGFRGKVLIGGKKLRPRDMMKLSYMVMQDVNHQLFAETVTEEVLLGTESDDEKPALELLERLNIAEYKERHPMSLSGGQKQRTAIASALLAGKKLLVFDEPTSGLDFRSMECTAELLRSIGNDVTVLIVTHDMELIDRCCTHVLHIENGNIT